MFNAFGRRIGNRLGATGLATAGLTGLLAGFLYEEWGRQVVTTTSAVVMAMFLVAARARASREPTREVPLI